MAGTTMRTTRAFTTTTKTNSPPLGSLTIVGTGYQVAGQVSAQAIASIRHADEVWHLVGDPPTRQWLESLNPNARSLYDAYEVGAPRRAAYRKMVERLLAPARMGAQVCGAFYGHPGVFVLPSHTAVAQARAEGIEAQMLPAISAEDCLFADLEVDPARDGCQSHEATNFLIYRLRHDPRAALILWQIGAIGVATFENEDLWSRQGLRVLAETLQETYPGTHEVVIYEAATLPLCSPRTEHLPLADLAAADVTTASTLYVPPAPRS